MPKNFTSILLAILAFVLIIEGIFIVFQQRAINDLKKRVIGESSSDLGVSADSAKSIARAVSAESLQKSISENIKDISGKVVGVSGKTITVEASIVDFSKLSNLGEGELNKSISALPQTTKQFKVKITEKTEISVKDISKVSAGVRIIVFAKELVYQTSELTAIKIDFPADIAGVLAEPNAVNGKVKEKTNTSLDIEVVVSDFLKGVDPQKIDPKKIETSKKTYKVLVNNATEFPNKKLSDIKIGDTVRAYSNKAVGNDSEFTADKIVFLVSGP
jgi:hypothetical protein